MAKRLVPQQLASVLVGSALLLSPMVSCAEYVMQLTSGRELHVLNHIPSHLVVTFWASHNLLDISTGYPHGVS
jgi:hypothetical protein